MGIGRRGRALMLRAASAMAWDFSPSLSPPSSVAGARCLVTTAGAIHRCELSINRVSVSSKPEEVVIAMGANLGDRVKNFYSALKLMREAGIQVKRHSSLYETIPMHVVEQPLFLNSAVAAETSLDPHQLLQALKRIENQLGRTSSGVRYGPRPIDLDIIFYGSSRVESEELRVPHPMYSSRPFVLAPLVDVLEPGSLQHGEVIHHWRRLGGEACVAAEGMRRVLPVGGKLLEWSGKTFVMGVLNVTPDSFSDGGKFMGVEAAVRRAGEMIGEGADFIDIGAQSTRPNATRLSSEEELRRLVPVLEGVGKLGDRDKILVSVDTFDSKVARAAVELGADLINDVSAGGLDPEMLPAVAELQVPCVLMHMRGDPCSMMSESNTMYDDLAGDVAAELGARIGEAEAAGIPAWSVIVDPGFGFSKTAEQNVELLARLREFKAGVSGRRGFGFPVLAGVSRKGFLGRICGRERGEERDMATVAAITAAVLNGGANIVRAHNVRGVRDAAMVVDSLRQHIV